MKHLGYKPFLIMLALMFTMILPGCGKTADDITAVQDVNTAQAAAEVDSAKTENSTDKIDTSAVKAINSGEKKKIVILQGIEVMQFRTDQVDTLLKTFEQKGFSAQNTDITVLKYEGDASKAQMLEKIQQLKPDVVLTFSLGYMDLLKKLEGANIPVIVESNAEGGYVDENGVPKQNITGIYTMPKDMVKNSYEFLNKIAPIKGKKAVFITAPGIPMFNRENIENALKSLNIELKAYIGDIKTCEDYYDAILKYNGDSEVGWILPGIISPVDKDGKPLDGTKAIKWMQDNVKKPCISYWDEGVTSLGCFPCSLAVNFLAVADQMGVMGVRILNGEDIKNVKAEYPQKINIVLNKKKADYMGMQFPTDILGSAKIYSDYNGTVVK